MSWIARGERDQLNYKSYLIARVTICTCETTGATLSLTRITEDKMKIHDRPYPNHSSYLPGVLEYQEPHHLHVDQGGPGKGKKKVTSCYQSNTATMDKSINSQCLPSKFRFTQRKVMLVNNIRLI